ncbi:MAG: hypothetical protein AABY64_14645 [Bdellovibrionota bacterium]
MRIYLQILFLTLIYSLGSLAQENRSLYDLTKSTCKYYSGDNPVNYISDTNHHYDNPLQASPLGEKILWSSFKSSYNDYNYLEQEQTLKLLMNSSELIKALDECYGTDQKAKNYFLFFLHQLDMQGKTSSFTTEAAGFAAMGTLLTKIGGVVVKRAAWMKNILKWTGRIVGTTLAASITIHLANQTYITIRKFNDGLGYELKDTTAEIKDATAEKLQEIESYTQLAEESIQSLKNEISNLNYEIKNAKTEKDRNELIELLNESEAIAKNLKLELSRTKKHLSKIS